MIWNKLYKYQQETVTKLLPVDKHMIALDMGLGKTLTSLAMLEKRFATMQRKRALILCQSTKVTDWAIDCVSFFPQKVIKYSGTIAQRDKLLDAISKDEDFILIAPYKTAFNDWKKLVIKFGQEDEKGFINMDPNLVLIIDESQTMKSHKSQIGKWGVELSKACKYVSLLSGDPISTGYHDLYNQLVMLGLEMTYHEFEEMFIIMKIVGHGTKVWPEIAGYKNTDILLNALHSQSVFKKTEEVIELPEMIIQPIHLDGNLTAYKSVLKHRVYKDYTFENTGSLAMAVRQLASGFIKEDSELSTHKVDAVSDILDSTNESVLIFYNFDQELKDLKNLLTKKNIKFYEINGHKNEYELSKTDKGRFVVLGQYKSASTGINYQQIHRTIYYSPTWSGSDYRQSLKRTNRIGQNNTCFYYQLITNGTMENRVYKALNESGDYSDEMFLNDINKLSE